MVQPVQLTTAPLEQADLDMLEIELSQTPTDDLIEEYNALRKQVRGAFRGLRVPGSGANPSLAMLQLIEAELRRRHTDWSEEETQMTIQRADVPNDGPTVITKAPRLPPIPDSTTYTERAALAQAQIEEFASELKTKTQAELEELYRHLTAMVGNLTGWVRRAAGTHPDLSRLELIEIEMFNRENLEWDVSVVWRGVALGALAGAGIGYISKNSTINSAAVGAAAGGVLARYSASFREMIGCPPRPEVNFDDE